MKTFAPDVKRRWICIVCGKVEKNFVHLKPREHKFQPRRETMEEAYYRAGYEEGVRKTADKAHWGPGWD